MKTSHQFYFQSAQDMKPVPSESVHLVVTSPPYPMIEMWDRQFSDLNPDIERALLREDGHLAFDLMHGELKPVWKELHRVLCPGGITCINIGDATRTLNKNFRLYTNHAAILNDMISVGFSALPAVIWRKQTNAPNKFMGSGMYPPGAYVTLEHEYILVLRKGEKREFKKTPDKERRRASAYFWEERNTWFSDVWFDLKGTGQKMLDKKTRERSGAYPFELPYRLIHMFSVKGDTVLDPFMGTGTTTCAAAASGRNSIGFELEEGLRGIIRSRFDGIEALADGLIDERIRRHLDFLKDREERGLAVKNRNRPYGFPVITRQEADLQFHPLTGVEEITPERMEVTYADSHKTDVPRTQAAPPSEAEPPEQKKRGRPKKTDTSDSENVAENEKTQLSLF